MDMLKMTLVIVGVLGLAYLLMNQEPRRETFVTKSSLVPQMDINTEEDVPQIAEAQLLQEREEHQDLEPQELLPKDENTIWDQVNPSSGKGTVAFKNFLEAGNMFGVDTQGSTLRNANQSIRSEPLIKQFEVSPWSQSTIDPDIYRKPLESSCRQ